jgi:hypothetical protein
LTTRRTRTEEPARSGDLGSRRPTSRRKPKRAGRRQQRSTHTPRVPRLREALTNLDGIDIAPERVRPSYQPVLRATIGLVEAGKLPTFVNIAKELGRSRQAVFRLFQRHPDLWAWIDRQVQAVDQHFIRSILYRHSMLAMQRSVSSAELVLKFHGGVYGTRKMTARTSRVGPSRAIWSLSTRWFPSRSCRPMSKRRLSAGCHRHWRSLMS